MKRTKTLFGLLLALALVAMPLVATADGTIVVNAGTLSVSSDAAVDFGSHAYSAGTYNLPSGGDGWAHSATFAVVTDERFSTSGWSMSFACNLWTPSPNVAITTIGMVESVTRTTGTGAPAAVPATGWDAAKAPTCSASPTPDKMVTRPAGSDATAGAWTVAVKWQAAIAAGGLAPNTYTQVWTLTTSPSP